MASIETMVAALAERFPSEKFEATPMMAGGAGTTGQFYVRVAPERIVDVLTFLHDDPRMAFEQLCDLTCVDYLNFPNATDRFGIVYSLLSLTHNHRLWLKVFVNDPAPRVRSGTAVYAGADWMEREVFDMFGIAFDGHPDLRRILTWDGFEANPLRKDYPLRGKGERENYEVLTRESA